MMHFTVGLQTAVIILWSGHWSLNSQISDVSVSHVQKGIYFPNLYRPHLPRHCSMNYESQLEEQNNCIRTLHTLNFKRIVQEHFSNFTDLGRRVRINEFSLFSLDK